MTKHTPDPETDADASSRMYLRRGELARQLGCSERHLERLALEGAGPPMVKLGRLTVYPLSLLTQWMAMNAVSSTTAATAARKRRA